MGGSVCGVMGCQFSTEGIYLHHVLVPGLRGPVQGGVPAEFVDLMNHVAMVSRGAVVEAPIAMQLGGAWANACSKAARLQRTACTSAHNLINSSTTSFCPDCAAARAPLHSRDEGRGEGCMCMSGSGL